MIEETTRRFVQAVKNCGKNRPERAARLRVSERMIASYERAQVPGLIESLDRLETAGVITINADAPRCPCGVHNLNA